MHSICVLVRVSVCHAQNDVFWQYTTFRVLSPDCLSKLSKKTVL